MLRMHVVVEDAAKCGKKPRTCTEKCKLIDRSTRTHGGAPGDMSLHISAHRPRFLRRLFFLLRLSFVHALLVFDLTACYVFPLLL